MDEQVEKLFEKYQMLVLEADGNIGEPEALPSDLMDSLGVSYHAQLRHLASFCECADSTEQLAFVQGALFALGLITAGELRKDVATWAF